MFGPSNTRTILVNFALTITAAAGGESRPFGCRAQDAAKTTRLNGREVPEIFADLTGGAADVIQAKALASNKGNTAPVQVTRGEADLVNAPPFLLSGIAVQHPDLRPMVTENLGRHAPGPAGQDVVPHGLVGVEDPLPMGDAVHPRGEPKSPPLSSEKQPPPPPKTLLRSPPRKA